MRVEKEEAATRTTYDLARFEMSDFYGLVNHPHGIIGYLKHPEHYYMNKKIKGIPYTYTVRFRIVTPPYGIENRALFVKSNHSLRYNT